MINRQPDVTGCPTHPPFRRGVSASAQHRVAAEHFVELMSQLRREGCGAWLQGMASAMAKIVLMEMDLYACIHDRLSFGKGL